MVGECSYPNIPDIQIKGMKKTFYCDLCLVTLSSVVTMMIHSSGVNHEKKRLALESKREENIRNGLMTGHEKMPGIRQIPNPEPVRVKVPVRLHDRIKDSQDPVVGLQHIQEFLTQSDPEMEPHYLCNLCGKKGSSNSMFSHLMGRDHRQEFAASKGCNPDMTQEDRRQLQSNNVYPQVDFEAEEEEKGIFRSTDININ